MNYVRNLQMSVVTAMMDFVTIAEFAAINYLKTMVQGPIAGLAPAGLPRVMLAEGVNAAGDIAKLIVFSSNQAVTANTG